MLVAVNLKAKTFNYYDSLGGSGESYIATLRKYLQEEAKLRGVRWVKSEWRSDPRVSPVPQQLNLYDCGAFLCRFADRLSRKQQLTFKPEHMEKKYRRCVVVVVVVGIGWCSLLLVVVVVVVLVVVLLFSVVVFVYVCNVLRT